MRITTSMTAASFAVLALALSGCSSDDGDDRAEPKKAKKTAEEQAEHKRTRSPSPSPSRTSASPSTSPSRTASPSPTRTVSPPVTPSRTASAPAKPASGASAVQGTWYYPVRDAQGRLVTLKVRGTAWTASISGGDSCSGTISRSMALASGNCDETSKSGTAVLSEGGRKLTFNWVGGQADRMQRTPPSS